MFCEEVIRGKFNQMKDIQNRYSLKFIDRELENKFQEYYQLHKIKQQRFALMSGLLLYLLFSFLDIVMIPEMKHIFIGMRVFIVFPTALSILILSYHKIFQKYSQQALMVSNLVAAIVIMIMIVIAKPPVTYLYYAGEILVIIYAFTFSGQQFIWSLGLSLFVIILYQIVAILNGTSSTLILNNNFFFISANFLSLAACYIIESTMRNDFYNSLLLEDEKEKVLDLNTNLEKMVTLRTEQLEETNDKLKSELIRSNELFLKQKELQDQLVQSQKMQAIGYLAGGVAHDFNNLLTIINGYSEMLIKYFDKDDREYEPLEQIIDAGDKAAHLTQQLLAFSRKQVMHPEVLNINDLIHDFEKMIRRLIETNIAIEYEYAGKDIFILVDPRQLEQVILNLVVNARDALTNGGKITISTSTLIVDENNHSKFDKSSLGNFAMLTISDNGNGIEKDAMDHIFEPFFTTKDFGKGTGLGLSTAYGIIAQSKGTIYVNSELNKGTEFRILLPLCKSGKNQNKEMQKSPTELFGSGVILIIEDNSDVRKLLEKTLKMYGFNTIITEDYEEAAPVFKQLYETIDLVISDVMMPGKNGEKIIEEFRGIKPDLKYILISGYVKDILDNKENIGFGNFLQKPFTQAELLSKIKSLLG